MRTNPPTTSVALPVFITIAIVLAFVSSALTAMAQTTQPPTPGQPERDRHARRPEARVLAGNEQVGAEREIVTIMASSP